MGRRPTSRWWHQGDSTLIWNLAEPEAGGGLLLAGLSISLPVLTAITPCLSERIWSSADGATERSSIANRVGRTEGAHRPPASRMRPARLSVRDGSTDGGKARPRVGGVRRCIHG